MKLVTWNCNGSFGKKRHHLLNTLKPDIAVIQECSEVSVSAMPEPYAALFVPSHKSRGIAVLFRTDLFQVSLLEKIADLVVAFDVSGPCSFRLIAVWTCPPQRSRYIAEIHRALDTKQSLFQSRPCIVAGDWNSHTRWDRPSQKRGHAFAVERLNAIGIQSAYHSHSREVAGSETSSTFFWYRHENKPYHIDYIFASDELLKTLDKVEVLPFIEWRCYSDHVPLVAEWTGTEDSLNPFAHLEGTWTYGAADDYINELREGWD